MKEQIKEMARVLEFVCDLQDEDLCISECDTCRATALYNAGYREQSEGEWIEASNNSHKACGKKCSLCGARIRYSEIRTHKYCHKCGAKMKGADDEKSMD